MPHINNSIQNDCTLSTQNVPPEFYTAANEVAATATSHAEESPVHAESNPRFFFESHGALKIQPEAAPTPITSQKYSADVYLCKAYPRSKSTEAKSSWA